MHISLPSSQLGFALLLVLLLLSAVTVGGLQQMAETNEQLELTIDELDQKEKLTTQLFKLVNQRFTTLNALTIAKHADRRGRIIVQLNQIDVALSQKLEQLLSLNLNSKEQKFLENLAQLGRISTALENNIVAMIKADQIDLARQTLLDKAIPAQNVILKPLQRLLDLQMQDSKATMAKAVSTSRFAFTLLMGLAILAVVLGGFYTIWIIQRDRKFKQSLHEEKERVEVTLHSIGDAVITTNSRAQINYLNPAAEKITGWENTQAIGQPLAIVFNIINESDRLPGNNPIEQCLVDGSVGQPNQPTVLISRHGEEYLIENTAAPIRDHSGNIIGAVLVIHDVSVPRQMAQKLIWHAKHDSLTGVANRSAFENRLATLIDSAQREKRQHAFCYLDLDQFKIVNDTCGHIAGDQLLKELVDAIQKKIHTIDTIARLGGDEFGILFKDCTLYQAKLLTNQIKQNITSFRFLWQDKTIDISASIGLVALTEKSGNPNVA